MIATLRSATYAMTEFGLLAYQKVLLSYTAAFLDHNRFQFENIRCFESEILGYYNFLKDVFPCNLRNIKNSLLPL